MTPPPSDSPAPLAIGSANADWLRALQRSAAIDLASSRTLACIVDEKALARPQDPALLDENGALSYSELAGLANRYARWAIERGLRKGDRVALMMDNCASYVAIWLGMTRIGVVVALVNPQLVGGSLAHCVGTAGAAHAIVEEKYRAVWSQAFGGGGPNLWSVGATVDAPDRLEPSVALMSPAPLAAHEGERPALSDQALLIYTSGTTGLPKAAIVSHFRIVTWSEWFAGIIDARPGDRLYNCLPMCHSVGGVAGIGAMLAAGGAIISRRQFSLTRFWSDVAESQATIFLYIGQLCTYLAGAPDDPASRRHNLRLCLGAGLQEGVWRKFEQRFSIKRIIEFYASTEGSFSLTNLEGEPGAIGRFPPFMAHLSPVALVRFDPDTQSPRRDENGFCLRCDVDEPGEAIGRISAKAGKPSGRFEGYSSAPETERKILRDVFEKGDCWFRTGDLMRQDKRRFFYFVDRIGDTFRWKGENVSTSQVADILCQAESVLDACVYGVEVPFTDGRAGMAALAVTEGFDLAALRRHVCAHLPKFARPVFLRLVKDITITGTFRAKKADYVQDGFAPAGRDGLIFFDDVRQERYAPLDAARYAEIRSGSFRF